LINQYEADEFIKLVNSYKSKNEVNVSVIIATYNRANLLKELLAIWKKVAKHTSCSYELIFSDDGSDDETFEFLSKYHDLPIVVLRNPHHGAANARNHAVEKAKGELLVFTGDDIFPEVDFIEKHWSYYKKNGPFTATLGKIEWKPGIKKTYLMTHITEIGCEQFSFPAFIEYAEVDFRHFYTSNISISSNVIKGIGKTFDKAFTKCNFEDIELGYRLSKKGIKIFYTPDVVGYHDHVYSDVNKFCHRQSIAGEMLAVFKKLHPMLSKKEVGVDVDAFNQSLLEYDNNKFFDMLSILGLIGLLFFKPLTKILEVLIGVSDSVLLRRLCSFFYGRLFVFYFYNGLAIGLKPNMEVIKRMSFVFRYLWGRKDTSSASKHQNVLSLANSLPEIGAACVYIYVEINDRVIIDSYKDICRPFLPYIIVSDYPCPSMHECRTYKYSPVDSAIAMDKYSFLNMAFCLMNYGFNFIIISRGLDEWPLLTASDLRTSIVYPANFDSVDSFLESNSTVCGRFLRLKGDEREYDNIDISKYFKNYAIRNSFLYQNCEQVKPVVITEFKNRISKKKPLVFVFPALMAVGGVERNTIEVMRRLNDQIDFVVITWEGHTVQTGSLFHQLNGVCLAYFDLAQVSQFESYLDNLKALNNIYNPDIVWVPNSSPWYFQNLKSIKQIFAKVAMVSQDVYDTENGWIKYYDNPDVKKYERYIAINKKIQDKFVKRYGLPKDRIDLIYPAIDKMKIEKVNSSKFNREEVLSKYGLKSNKLNFAFIGRLTEQKQPIRFIKFAKIILSYRDDINFIIVGDGPLGQEVDLFIENHKLGDRIKKIKYLEAVYEFTKAMDGLIITSIYEGLPIVAIEAMCLGTPVMTTGVGDLPLFVDKYNIGVIATGYEVRDLETAFKKFLVGLSTFKANVVTHMNECTDFFSSQRAANLTLNCFQLAAPGILESYENKERKPYYPLVSVIIPSYNHERYIKTAVNSVLMQTYPNIELIVVDDGSKDNSVSILRTIKDKRFTLLEQENQGAHMAINRGLGMAKGDLLTILNSDDVYHPDRIRQMVALFDNEPEVGLVCSWISCIDSNGKQTGVKKGWHNMEPWPIKNGEFIKRIDNDFVRNLSASNFIATTSNMLFKRQVLNDVGGMRNLKFAHDWDFALRVAEKYQCKLIEYPLVQYRLHSTNTINTNHKHMLFEICWIYATHIPIISNTFLGAENFDSNTESLMESLNLQGNGRLVKSLIDRMRELSKKGIISPEEILLDDRKMLQTFISQVME
jgi:glycosyltransferase involved in cell wall biosynthesis